MMKRRLAFSALVLCLVLGLAACGGSSKPEESKAFSTDLTAFYETIFTDPQNSPAMMHRTDSSGIQSHRGSGIWTCSSRSVTM